MNNFYVYAHVRNDNQKVFYIGKGNCKRAYKKSGRSKYWNNIVAKYGYTVTLLKQNLDEETAFSEEIRYIQVFKAFGHKLCNLTDGGEGTSGSIKSEETRLKMSKSGRNKSEETLEKMRLANRNRSKETKQKLSNALKGKPKSESHRNKLREANLGKKASIETRIKLSVKRQERGSPNKKRVVCIETGEVFESGAKAAFHVSIYRGSISKAIKLKTKAGGFHWAYYTSTDPVA